MSRRDADRREHESPNAERIDRLERCRGESLGARRQQVEAECRLQVLHRRHLPDALHLEDDRPDDGQQDHDRHCAVAGHAQQRTEFRFSAEERHQDPQETAADQERDADADRNEDRAKEDEFRRIGPASGARGQLCRHAGLHEWQVHEEQRDLNRADDEEWREETGLLAHPLEDLGGFIKDLHNVDKGIALTRLHR